MREYMCESLDKLEVLQDIFERQIRRAYGWGARRDITLHKEDIKNYSGVVTMVIREDNKPRWGLLYAKEGIHIYENAGVREVDLMEGFEDQAEDEDCLDYDPFRGVANEWSYRERAAIRYAKNNFTKKQYRAFMGFMNTYVLGMLLEFQRDAYREMRDEEIFGKDEEKLKLEMDKALARGLEKAYRK